MRILTEKIGCVLFSKIPFSLCRTFLTLVGCVDDVMKINCGTEAAKLFKNLAKARVPTAVCESEAPEDDASASGAVLPHSYALCLCVLCAIRVCLSVL